jgi:hypothetical protein
VLGALVWTIGQIGPDRRVAVGQVRDGVKRLCIDGGIDRAKQDVRAAQRRSRRPFGRRPIDFCAKGKLDGHGVNLSQGPWVRCERVEVTSLRINSGPFRAGGPREGRSRVGHSPVAALEGSPVRSRRGPATVTGSVRRTRSLRRA